MTSLNLRELPDAEKFGILPISLEPQGQNSKAQTSMNNKALVLFTHKEKILAPDIDKFWLGLTPQVKDTSSGTPNECRYSSPDLVEE